MAPGSSGGSLRLGDGRLAVDVPAETPPEALEAIRSLLAQLDLLVDRTAQLHVALESRVAIEQAKGVLAERLKTTPDAAFEVLRSAARRRRMPLREVAAAVVATIGDGDALLS